MFVAVAVLDEVVRGTARESAAPRRGLAQRAHHSAVDCAGVALWLAARLHAVVIASFVAGPGSTTLPMVVYSSVRMGVSPQINAMASLIVLFVSIAVIVAGLTLRWRGEGE